MVTMQDIGANSLLQAMNAYKNNVISGVTAAVAVVSNDVANYAKVNHPFTNRTYNLENSIIPLPVEVKGAIIESRVMAGMEYAGYVEFGTSKSSPYPYLIPAIDANNKNLQETVAAAVVRAGTVVKVI